ncbi:MAG: bifunctional DNA primase/polymerase, partial [Candidatus Thermoplasmatota archaeon]|nr:bifunctional DNA primase/polymerase [Candidatus Thermoplasmatota archaeon]
MIEIPPHLQREDIRFVKILDGTKAPYEEDWNISKNYKWDEPEFQEYLKTAKAYGVVGRFGYLLIIDADEDEFARNILFKLPKTFTTKTGSGKYHIYFIVPDLGNEKIILDEKNGHFGDIQGFGQCVIGAGSIHPETKNLYEIFYDEEIKTIKKKDLMEVLEPYLKKEKKSNNISNGMHWDIAKIVEKSDKLQGLTRKGDALQGEHPIHSSRKGEKGSNIRIDLDKGENGLWTCYRCNSGGDAVYLVGMLEGIIDCSDCTEGFFDKKENKEKFKEILKIGREKYGYEIPENKTFILKEELLKKYNVWQYNGDTKYCCYKCLADLIRNEKGNFLIVSNKNIQRKSIYFYKDGYYQDTGEQIIREATSYYLGSIVKKNSKTEVLDQFNDFEAIDRSDLEPPEYLINLNDCVLDARTMTRLPHDPKYRFLSKLAVDYNPEAECPKIEKFFKEVLREEEILPMQELFGYCLQRRY